MRTVKANSARLSTEELDFLRGLFVEPTSADVSPAPSEEGHWPLNIPPWLCGEAARITVDHGDHRLEFDARMGCAGSGSSSPWRVGRPRLIDCRGRARSARETGPRGISLHDPLGRFSHARLQDVSVEGAALQVGLACPLLSSLRPGQCLDGLCLAVQGHGHWVISTELVRMRGSRAALAGRGQPEVLLGLRFRSMPGDADDALRARLLEVYEHRLGLA